MPGLSVPCGAVFSGKRSTHGRAGNCGDSEISESRARWKLGGGFRIAVEIWRRSLNYFPLRPYAVNAQEGPHVRRVMYFVGRDGCVNKPRRVRLIYRQTYTHNRESSRCLVDSNGPKIHHQVHRGSGRARRFLVKYWSS
jgi:hypothetical protein